MLAWDLLDWETKHTGLLVYIAVKVQSEIHVSASQEAAGIRAQLQSNYAPLFAAPEALAWLAGVVYGMALATMFVSYLQSQRGIPGIWITGKLR